MPATLSAPVSPRARQSQLLFDYRLPAGPFVKIMDVAAASGWSVDSVVRAFDEGKLLGNKSTMSGAAGKEKREHHRIPRELAVIFLATIANYGADEALGAMVKATAKWPRSLKDELIQQLSR